MNQRIVVVTVAILLSRVHTESDIIEGPICHGDHTYYLTSESSWWEAQDEAMTLRGNLAAINNQEEHDLVWNTFGDGHHRHL